MKVLIPILIGLLVVGCGEKQFTNTNEGNSTPIKTAKKKSATPLTPEEQKFVGTYKRQQFRLLTPYKFELLKKGRVKGLEGLFSDFIFPSPLPKWKLVDGEIHTSGTIKVFIINPDGSLTARRQNTRYRRD